ncbi:MAG: hypothetical protein HZB50_18820 [Chloroflexi bacterium]|nr:hypothetical protein [Chloroflexota bacterium]
MKTFKMFVTTILVLMLGIPAISANAAGPRSASLALTTTMPNPVLIGNEVTFDLVIFVANITPGVTGADIYLRYDPALVGPSVNPSVPTAEARPDFFGVSVISVNELLPAASCPGGVNPCIHLVLAGPAQITQSGVAVRFHFNTLAAGNACFGVSQSNLKDADGFDVTHTLGSDTCVLVQTRTVTGLVLRQGVPAVPNPGGGTIGCARVTGIGTWTFGPFDADATARFSILNLPTGTYTFRAFYPGYLTAEKTGFAVTGNADEIDLGSVTLRGGDVNSDNAINILDVGSILSQFGATGVSVGSSGGFCGFDEAADINDDGNINISDLAITAGNWGQVGPKVWP